MKTNQLSLYDVTEIKLSYRSKFPASTRKTITSSKHAYDILINNWDHDTIEYREEFKVLLLNRANKVLAIITISSGGVSGTVVDIKMIFQAALKANASGIIVCHNHPSGNSKPSEADKMITRKIASAGKVLDINLLDHIVLCFGSYFSFADEGEL